MRGCTKIQAPFHTLVNAARNPSLPSSRISVRLVRIANEAEKRVETSLIGIGGIEGNRDESLGSMQLAQLLLRLLKILRCRQSLPKDCEIPVEVC
jgi:hypothetical protein